MIQAAATAAAGVVLMRINAQAASLFIINTELIKGGLVFYVDHVAKIQTANLVKNVAITTGVLLPRVLLGVNVITKVIL